MKRILQTILFLVIQIIFIPFALIGVFYGLYIEMHVSKKMGLSFSAGQSLQYRWIMHYFDTREDMETVKFTKAYPGESHVGLLGVMGALIISHKLFGFKSKLNTLVEPGYEKIDSTSGIRVLKFDEAMEKYVDKIDQVVLPGAGFDLINQKYTKGKDISVFEIDQTNTLNVKLSTLNKANIEHNWIQYIPVEYDKESWADKLIEAGFDKNKKTLFLWQSVSLYLEPELVKETLKLMSELCNEESVIIQDFYSQAFMKGEISKVAKRNMDLIAKAGEPWKFALDMSKDPEDAIRQLLDECNLKLTDHYQFGDKLDGQPFYSIVEAMKK